MENLSEHLHWGHRAGVTEDSYRIEVSRTTVVKENTSLIQKGAQLVTLQWSRAVLAVLTNFHLFLLRKVGGPWRGLKSNNLNDLRNEK